MYPQIGCKQKMSAVVVGNFQYASCDLLFALSLEYNILVYLIQRKVMLEKDNFHLLVFE